MRRFDLSFLSAAAAVALASAGIVRAQDWSAWSRHADIYYDASPSGANLAQDVRGFPVLVRLTGADFDFAPARSGGEDLRFSKPDGTSLPFEIERWDKAGQRAEIWVRMDTVKAGRRGALMKIHWGHATSPAASNAAAVFSGTDGFVAAWHLGLQHPASRPNAVAGGLEAVPVNYNGNEQRPGVIGWADSLDGASPGDYLQTWEPFDNLANGFTYSVWAYPSSVREWARFMDFGNGPALDNLVLARGGTTNDLVFDSYNAGVHSRVVATGAIALRQWQHFAVTVSGTSARIYRNGVLVASGSFQRSVSASRRAYNYIGRSNWAADSDFHGKVDEPVVARAARSADWIRLAYESQKPGSTFLSFTAPITCVTRFAVPADTTVPEDGRIRLAARADCADEISWSQVSGPVSRILDPGVAVLDLPAPRVAGDTLAVFRFTARYGDSARTGSVRVALQETVPDPIFTLVEHAAFQGRDTLHIAPVVENLAAILASGQALTWSWSLAGAEVDTAWRAAGLLLRRSGEIGPLKVRLCLRTNGPEACKETEVVAAAPTTLLRPVFADPRGTLARPAYGADGRSLPPARGSLRRFLR